jgi:uncharacterized protein (TIGR02996 family)
MRDEAAFWQALQASPGDEVARLAFADWLDERGDARAAWVRDPDVFRWMGPNAPGPIPAMVKALRKGAQMYRLTRAFETVGAPAVPALLAEARGANDPLRGRIASVLFTMSQATAAALPDLLRAAEDEGPQVRIVALHGLAPLTRGSPEARARLAAALIDPSNEVQGTALKLLVGERSYPGPEAIPNLLLVLRCGDERQGTAAAALGRIGPAAVEAIPDLVPLLGTDSGFLAGMALGMIGPASVGPVLEVVPTISPDVRHHVDEALLRVGPAAVPLLREAVEGPVPETRHVAAELLARLAPDATSVTALTRALEEQTDPEILERVLRALSLLKQAARPAVGAVLRLLSDDACPAHLHYGAIDVLSGIGPPAEPGALLALRRLVGQGGSQERRGLPATAATALVQLGASATAFLEVLRACSPSSPAAAEARETLRHLARRPPPGLYALGAFEQPGRLFTPRLAALVGRALGPDAAEALPLFREALGEEELRARVTALLALAHVGTPEAAAAIVPALRDRVKEVRAQAAYFLGRIGADVDGVTEALLAARKDRAAVVRAAAEVARTELQRG